MQVETSYKGYSLTTDNQRMDVIAIHAYLSRSYWVVNIPLDSESVCLLNADSSIYCYQKV